MVGKLKQQNTIHIEEPAPFQPDFCWLPPKENSKVQERKQPAFQPKNFGLQNKNKKQDNYIRFKIMGKSQILIYANPAQMCLERRLTGKFRNFLQSVTFNGF